MTPKASTGEIALVFDLVLPAKFNPATEKPQAVRQLVVINGAVIHRITTAVKTGSWNISRYGKDRFDQLTTGPDHSDPKTGTWLGKWIGQHDREGYAFAGVEMLIELTADEAASLRGEVMPDSIQEKIEKEREDSGIKDPWVGPLILSTPLDEYINNSVAVWLDAVESGSITNSGKTAVPVSDPIALVVEPLAAKDGREPVRVGTVLTRPNGQVYVARKLRDRLSDVQWLRDLLACDMPALLYGPPGTGKTALIEVAYEGRAITVMGSEDTDRADFEGSYVQTADGSFVWVDGPLLRAMEEGVPLFIDEIGLISPKTLSLVYAAMDGRQEVRVTANPERGVVKAKPGFMIVAATNPDAPGVRLSEALLSRFVAQAEVGTDWDVARRLGLPENITAALRNLDEQREASGLRGSPQMREAIAFIRTSAVFGEDIALANLVAASHKDDREYIIDMLKRAVGRPVSALALS